MEASSLSMLASKQSASLDAIRRSSRRVVVIAGPTAVGKSDLAIELATALKRRGRAAEIVIADSVQVYTDLEIGSNKPTKEERSLFRHHLVDIMQLGKDEFTAGEFHDEARRIIDDILNRGAVPIVVGGTMMYIGWLLHGKPSAPKNDANIRAAVKEMLDQVEGDWERGLDLLRTMDADKATKIQRNDWYRLSRAMEVLMASKQGETFKDYADKGAVPSRARKASTMTDKRLNKLLKDSRKASPASGSLIHGINSDSGVEISKDESRMLIEDQDYNKTAELDIERVLQCEAQCYFANAPRMDLAHRIDLRCEKMLILGLLDEVGELLLRGVLVADSSAGRAIGYRQTMEYLNHIMSSLQEIEHTGNTDLTTLGSDWKPSVEAKLAFRTYLATFMQASRQYAKIQVKWFRQATHFRFLHLDDREQIKPLATELADRVLRNPNSEPEQRVNTKEQDALRMETYLEAKDMKRFVVKLEIVRPDSPEETELIRKAEQYAQALLTRQTEPQ